MRRRSVSGGYLQQKETWDEKPYRGSCVDVDCFAGPCADEALRGTQVRDRGEDQGKRRTGLTLDIVPNEQVKEGEGKVVGTCDGSTQKIVYKRGVAEAPRDMPAKSQ